MLEQVIERYEVITPNAVTEDSYGNISVHTTDDKEVKINKKHESLHDLVRQASDNTRAVKLGYAVYMNKEYVHTAELFDGKPPEARQVEPITAGKDKEILKVPAPQELGMWWKELGEMIRAKDIDLTKPTGKALRTAYYAQMFAVLGIKIEKE